MLDLIIKNGQCYINGKLEDKDIAVKEGKILKIGEISEEAKDLSKKLNKDEGLVQAIINESNRILSIKKNVIIYLKNLLILVPFSV